MSTGGEMAKKNYTIAKSKALLNRYDDLLFRGYIPHKNIFRQVDMGYPAFAQRASGARFWDVDGNAYLDYLMGFGPIVLGYDDPAVCRAVQKQMADGTVYGLAHPRELVVAELLIEAIPGAEVVGFFIGGSAATSSAVRLSRVYTGRDRVIMCGYHGWHDWARPGDEGVPQTVSELTSAVPYGDLDALESHLKKYDSQVACVVMETVQGSGPPDGFLQGCVDLAHAHGAVCVFDETKVGFRVAMGGAGEYYGVIPDIATFGKACCNGYAGSFIAGKREILGSKACQSVWMTATAHGDPLSLTAMEVVIGELQRRNGIAYQWKIGNRLIEGINAVCEAGGLSYHLIGVGPMPRPVIDDSDRDRCMEMLRRCLAQGYYLHPSHPMFLSLAHTEADIEDTIDAVREAIGGLD